MTDSNINTLEACNDFADIQPYNDHQFKEKIEKLIAEPGFEHAVRYVMPDVDYDDFARKLLTVETQMDFQIKVMGPFLELLVARTTHGLTCDGLENYEDGKNYTFITNHRDIVLDASFLNLCFIRAKKGLTQVAIGNNLLIFDWITDLVKINRSFIVKRDTGVREALEAAKKLSAYIHYVIKTLKESVWIAQREGRAKDSSDQTQDAVIKMLALSGEGDSKANILDLNIMPVAISYEYDPNDYLKAREFLLKRRDPEYKKTQHDDLFSMETGLLRQKGRVHFRIGNCINDELQQFAGEGRAEVVRRTCELIDRSIHCGYYLYPCNYIAYDEIEGSEQYKDQYTASDVEEFNAYLDGQLDKVDVPDITPEEREFMRHAVLSMYANPVRNKQIATQL